MDNTDLSLTRFFFPTGLMSQEEWSKTDSDETVGALKQKLVKEARVKWPATCDLLLKKLSDALEIKFLNIMETGWKKYSALLKYTDREQYPPDEIFLVSLAEHTLKSEHKPSIEILVDGKVHGKIDFDVAVSLTLSGITLKIQDGRIKGVATGSCKGKGMLKCENTVILDKPTETITLPGSIDLGEGVPIGP